MTYYIEHGCSLFISEMITSDEIQLWLSLLLQGSERWAFFNLQWKYYKLMQIYRKKVRC